MRILLVEARGQFDFKISPKIFPKDHPKEEKIMTHIIICKAIDKCSTLIVLLYVDLIHSRAIYFEIKVINAVY